MTKTRIKRVIISFLLCLVLCFGMFTPFLLPVSAAETTYSNVLEDLLKAGNFKIENFPNFTLEYIKQVNEDTDISNDQAYLEVMQIAESSSGELYLYVYQPTDKESEIIATSVLLSTEYSPDGHNLNSEIYNVELVSSDSVFDKYVVKDFRVSEEPYRYYNIVTLYRGFNPDIDEVTTGGVIENFQLGIDVGQQWCAYYENDSIIYEKSTFNTVEIDIGYTSNVTFSSGITINNFFGSFESGDAWFIAFNVEDYIVKKIYDADLRYKIRSCENIFGVGLNETEYGEWSDYIPLTLKNEDVITYQGDGLFAKEYTWNKIVRSADFIAQLEDQDVRISDEMRTELSQNAWVFAFLLTERQTNSYDATVSTVCSDVANVTVIRLHFMDVKGDIYNLGVVSDQVNPDGNSDAFGSGVDSQDWWQKIMMFLAAILIGVIIIILFPVLKFIADIIWLAFKSIFFIALWILNIPFAILSWLFRR